MLCMKISSAPNTSKQQVSQPPISKLISFYSASLPSSNTLLPSSGSTKWQINILALQDQYQGYILSYFHNSFSNLSLSRNIVEFPFKGVSPTMARKNCHTCDVNACATQEIDSKDFHSYSSQAKLSPTFISSLSRQMEITYPLGQCFFWKLYSSPQLKRGGRRKFCLLLSNFDHATVATFCKL